MIIYGFQMYCRKKLLNYHESFLLSRLTILSLVVLFLAGCQSKRASLLKETLWYEDSVKWYDASYPGVLGLTINIPSIWVGKITRVDHSQSNGNISKIYLEDAERLKPFSMFSKGLRLFASKENFNTCQPKEGEYWAFRVYRNIKGTMGITESVKLMYNLDADKLYIIGCDKPVRRINNSGKGYVVVLNGLQITQVNQDIIPAKLKTGINNKMTTREIVHKIGKGWLPSFISTGIIRWMFSDGSVMSIPYPDSLDEKVDVMIRKTHNVDEVNIILLKTIQQIRSDLKKIKTKFPQLKNIDSANIGFKSFYYSKGWVSDSKIDGVIFKKDGCDISFWVRYPAETREIQQLEGSPLIRIKNGKNIEFWRSVRAENTEQGKRFKKEVNKIISKNLREMFELIGQRVVSKK